MAAVLLEHYVQAEPRLADRDISVRSAGLHASNGSPAAEGAKRAVQQKGLSLESHGSSLFGEEHARADLILTMTEEHKAELILNFPHAADRVYTLKEFAGHQVSRSIADPFGQDDRAYMDTLEEIDAAVRKVVQRLVNEWKES